MEPSSFAGGPSQLVLTASVARRYYLDGRSKVEIADEFRLSRFKVARLIDQALSSGLVRIEIRYAGGIDVDLSARLQETLGLKRCLVVDTPEEDAGPLRVQLGGAAAALLTEIVTAEDVLGLAWARAVNEMTNALTSLAPAPVVQLTGALSRPDVDANSVELVRNVARISGGPAYLFYAPLLVPDGATARVLRQQPEVAAAVAHFASVTKAVVGLGRWQPGQSTLYDAMDDKSREQLARRGVVADISGVFVTGDGEPVQSRFTDRVIAINAEQMSAIDEVIAIAYGRPKLPAVRAAVRDGLVNGLVTHSTLAQALLATQPD